MKLEHGWHPYITMRLFSTPRESQGLLYSRPFPPTAFLRRHHAQTVIDSSSSYKIEYVIGMKNFLYPKRASKLHQWFKNYGYFTEGVNFDYWWSCIGKVLRLQPAQQACYYHF